MHIIIGLLTAVAGLIWALNSLQRSGLDLNSFNPFTWARRRQWAKLYGTKPLYNLENSMEVAAVLVVAVLKQEGEITREQKLKVLEMFQSEFKLSESKAMELFVASGFLIKDELELSQSVQKIIAPRKGSFSTGQVNSLLFMLNSVARIEGEPTKSQLEIIKRVELELKMAETAKSKWD